MSTHTSSGESSAVPPPVDFTLARDEFRSAARKVGLKRGTFTVGTALVVTAAVGQIAVLAAYGAPTPREWPGFIFALAYATILVGASLAWRRSDARAVLPTRVVFEDAAIDIVRGPDARAATTLPLARVRVVQLVAGAIVVRGALGLALVIPLRALPDGGEAVMRYFDERLVTGRMLRRGPGPRTLIVNSAARASWR